MHHQEPVAVGDRFEAKVSRVAAVVRVIEIQERKVPGKRTQTAYVCYNETSGRRATFKSKRRFGTRLPRHVGDVFREGE